MSPLVSVSKLQSPVAFDVESNGLSTFHGDRPYAISLCDRTGQQSFFRAPIDPFTRIVTWSSKDLDQIRVVLENPKIAKVGWNLPFDRRMMASVGVKTIGPKKEAIFAVHGVDCQQPSFKLKKIAEKYLEVDRSDETILHKATCSARRKAKKLGWKLAEEIPPDYWMAPEELLLEYCLADTRDTMMIWLMFEERMKELGVIDVFNNEMELMDTIYEMVSRGPAVDVLNAKKELVKYKELSAKQRAVLDKQTRGVNIDSPKQLAYFLYSPKPTGLGLNPPEYTEKGNPSTNVESLVSLKSPITDSILEVRHSEKTIDFLEQYLRLASPDKQFKGVWSLHCDYRQCGGVTARISSANPNLQNVANFYDTRALRPLKLRHLFVPRPGYVWILCDYKQVEIVIFAFVAQEDHMLAAIKTGRDLHTEATNRVWGGRNNPLAIERAIHALGLDVNATSTPESQAAVLRYRENRDQKTDIARKLLADFDWDIVAAEKSVGVKHTRNLCKMLSFLKIFGGGADAAAGLIGITKNEAKKVLNDYDAAFPKIMRTIDQYSRKGRQEGFITTLYGRRITVDPDASYRAMNYMIQGSAADLMKSGLRKAGKICKESGLDVHPLMTIHDELIFEVKKEHLYPWFIRKIKAAMVDTEGRIPYGIDVSFSIARTNWLEKKPLKGF